jgi:RNA-binding protein 8A
MSFPPRHHHRHEHADFPRPSSVVGPLKSINGWVLFVTGIHEEAQEDDLSDLFSEFGKVKSVHLNLDRKTGLAKGYCMIEFDKKEEAQDAINSLHGSKFLNRIISVHWAFCKSSTTALSSTSTIERGTRRGYP